VKDSYFTNPAKTIDGKLTFYHVHNLILQAFRILIQKKKSVSFLQNLLKFKQGF